MRRSKCTISLHKYFILVKLSVYIYIQKMFIVKWPFCSILNQPPRPVIFRNRSCVSIFTSHYFVSTYWFLKISSITNLFYYLNLFRKITNICLWFNGKSFINSGVLTPEHFKLSILYLPSHWIIESRSSSLVLFLYERYYRWKIYSLLLGCLIIELPFTIIKKIFE